VRGHKQHWAPLQKSKGAQTPGSDAYGGYAESRQSDLEVKNLDHAKPEAV